MIDTTLEDSVEDRKILVTGTAGFIGFHLVSELLNLNYKVVGIDSINSYYDTSLKRARLAEHGIRITQADLDSRTGNEGIPAILSSIHPNYKFYHGGIDDRNQVEQIFAAENPTIVINLAAQPGVRYSLTHPRDHITSNIDGFLNILEECRNYKIKHLLYASSSSIYGLNTQLPFKTSDNADHPISLYGATKKSNELMAHCYSHLFDLPTTGLRFFTVYGLWGRPDMALYSFTKSIIDGIPMDLFNNGDMIRDFTYVDDIVQSIVRLIDKIPNRLSDKNLLNSPNSSTAPYRILNIGNNKPIILSDFLKVLEEAIGQEAIINYKETQPGDVYATQADIDDLIDLIDYAPTTSVKEGVSSFVNWYKEYYNN
ncbi:MAG: NAD-dependent epimerase/dehydratase family protein [Bacteroidetes bacterium]|nr:NAD-dependent epimerase/dehydratase family protein [Bacteroidota bacterium]